MNNNHLPRIATVDRRVQESPTIFSLRLRFVDPDHQEVFEFAPGQFNMLSLFGVGEIPLSIVSDPEDSHFFDHTIRVVGQVSRALGKLKPGDQVGVRGPFGRGWPLAESEGRDMVLVTGGLGCAPVVSVIHYLMRRRSDFGRLHILQGVKHADDLIWRQQYQAWGEAPNTEVLLAADIPDSAWLWQQGQVTELLDEISFDPSRTTAMLCGPEVMLLTAVAQLREQRLADDQIWVSLERNMQCGIGLCGHCQIGPKFVCRDGPVFSYADIADFLGAKGF